MSETPQVGKVPRPSDKPAPRTVSRPVGIAIAAAEALLIFFVGSAVCSPKVPQPIIAVAPPPEPTKPAAIQPPSTSPAPQALGSAEPDAHPAAAGDAGVDAAVALATGPGPAAADASSATNAASPTEPAAAAGEAAEPKPRARPAASGRRESADGGEPVGDEESSTKSAAKKRGKEKSKAPAAEGRSSSSGSSAPATAGRRASDDNALLPPSDGSIQVAPVDRFKEASADCGLAEKDIAREAWRRNWPTVCSVASTGKVFLLIPLKGSLDGEVHEIRHHPNFEARITLRAGSESKLSLKQYKVNRLGFKEVRIGQNEDGATRVRIRLLPDASDPAIEVKDG